MCGVWWSSSIHVQAVSTAVSGVSCCFLFFRASFGLDVKVEVSLRTCSVLGLSLLLSLQMDRRCRSLKSFEKHDMLNPTEAEFSEGTLVKPHLGTSLRLGIGGAGFFFFSKNLVQRGDHVGCR